MLLLCFVSVFHVFNVCVLCPACILRPASCVQCHCVDNCYFMFCVSFSCNFCVSRFMLSLYPVPFLSWVDNYVVFLCLVSVFHVFYVPVSCVVCRVSCVVCRVSCVVCRVSCVVCRVSCVVCPVSCVLCPVSCVLYQCHLGLIIMLFFLYLVSVFHVFNVYVFCVLCPVSCVLCPRFCVIFVLGW